MPPKPPPTAPPPTDPRPAPLWPPPKLPRWPPPLVPPRMTSPTVPPLDLAAFRLSRPQLLCRRTSLPRPMPSNAPPVRLRSTARPGACCCPGACRERLASGLPALADVAPACPLTASRLTAASVRPVLPDRLSGLPAEAPVRPVPPVTVSGLPALPAPTVVPPGLPAPVPRSIQLPS